MYASLLKGEKKGAGAESGGGAGNSRHPTATAAMLAASYMQSEGKDGMGGGDLQRGVLSLEGGGGGSGSGGGGGGGGGYAQYSDYRKDDEWSGQDYDYGRRTSEEEKGIYDRGVRGGGGAEPIPSGYTQYKPSVISDPPRPVTTLGDAFGDAVRGRESHHDKGGSGSMYAV